jgi:hypothetical protein
MRSYRVAWEIDIKADSVKDAAEQARKIQLDPNSTATVFTMVWSGTDEDGNDYVGTSTIDLQPTEE